MRAMSWNILRLRCLLFLDNWVVGYRGGGEGRRIIYISIYFICTESGEGERTII